MRGNYLNMFWVSILFAWLLLYSPEGSSQQALVCADNNYALCSHANCECLGEDGSPGACEEYQGTDAGWASCKCPLVKTGNSGDEIAYNANFATLDCAEREQPGAAGTAFPGFVQQTTPKVYSTYSFGDSLPGKLYGTLNDAKLIICDQPELMTLCLDMPCTYDEQGVATCYCQNVSVSKCPSGGWNTLGAKCDQGRCDPGDDRVWSAACIGQTLDGIASNTIYIRQYLDAEFSDIPAYCAAL